MPASISSTCRRAPLSATTPTPRAPPARATFTPTPASTYLDPSSPSGVGVETNSGSTLTDAESGDRSSLRSAGQVNTPKLAPMDLSGDGSSQDLKSKDSSLSGVRTATMNTQPGFH